MMVAPVGRREQQAANGTMWLPARPRPTMRISISLLPSSTPECGDLASPSDGNVTPHFRARAPPFGSAALDIGVVRHLTVTLGGYHSVWPRDHHRREALEEWEGPMDDLQNDDLLPTLDERDELGTSDIRQTIDTIDDDLDVEWEADETVQ
jgi:hypothetical protein